jgi:hypothetical protein
MVRKPGSAMFIVCQKQNKTNVSGPQKIAVLELMASFAGFDEDLLCRKARVSASEGGPCLSLRVCPDTECQLK